MLSLQKILRVVFAPQCAESKNTHRVVFAPQCAESKNTHRVVFAPHCAESKNTHRVVFAPQCAESTIPIMVELCLRSYNFLNTLFSSDCSLVSFVARSNGAVYCKVANKFVDNVGRQVSCVSSSFCVKTPFMLRLQHFV